MNHLFGAHAGNQSDGMQVVCTGLHHLFGPAPEDRPEELPADQQPDRRAAQRQHRRPGPDHTRCRLLATAAAGPGLLRRRASCCCWGRQGGGDGDERDLAVGETVILLHPPLPLGGASIGTERGCQQNDRTLADG